MLEDNTFSRSTVFPLVDNSAAIQHATPPLQMVTSVSTIQALPPPTYP